MTRLGPYSVHPFADEFPLIEGEEFEELVTDIKRNGLRQPLVLNYDKTVLIDGRNRYRACNAAGLDPVFDTLPQRYTEAMILDYIVSTNIERRHLNAGQKGLVGVKYEQAYAAAIRAEESARKSKLPPTVAPASDLTLDTDNSDSTLRDPAKSDPARRGRDSAAKAARIVGTSRDSVVRAKALLRDAPDLADKVRSGQMALDTADKQRKQRVRSEPKPEPAPKSNAVMLTLRTHTGEEVAYRRPQAKATFNETKGDGISWAAWSWNPVTGCLHGCDYCYARGIATNERFKDAFPAGFTPLFHHERVDAPANTLIPAARQGDPAWRRVFVCSMADLYGRWVPDEWIDRVHDSMLSSPQWEYLTLTKFPARYVGLDMPTSAWVGTSVDEQKRVRIAEDAFRQIDGVKVKWLSLEPLKEPLEFSDLSMFDWVVIGAQTETRQPAGVVPAFAPPAEWVVRITAQALEAGCRIHWKPNLRSGPGMRWLDQYPDV